MPNPSRKRKQKRLSTEPVVHPIHEHAYDPAYHDVMNKLSYIEWQSVMQLATETGHFPKEVRRVLKTMIDEGAEVGDHEVLETAQSDDGKVYRFGGVSRPGEAA